jgi:hypothetical protein
MHFRLNPLPICHRFHMVTQFRRHVQVLAIDYDDTEMEQMLTLQRGIQQELEVVLPSSLRH